MDELKPCPFCGGEAELYEDVGGYSVDCGVCGAGIGYFGNGLPDAKVAAMAAWNRRAAPKCSEATPKCDRDALLALADRMAMMPQCDLCPVTVSCTEHADGCAGALMGHYASSIREACGEAR